MRKVSDALLFTAADIMAMATNTLERATTLAKGGRMIDSHLLGAWGHCQRLAGHALGSVGLWLGRKWP